MIRLTIPSIEQDDLDAVEGVLRSGFLVQGRQVSAFEETLAKYIGVKHVVAVSNCTSALHLSLLALDTKPGDLVLVTAYSYTATANVIELCGAIPVFVDIQLDTYNMDPDQLAEKLATLMNDPKKADKVKAIIPVHTFGQTADMTRITTIAEKYNIPVIEDAACALGSKWDDKKAGTWGTLGCFSFHPRKAITTGEGGAVTTNDDNLANKIRALRNHGQDPLSPSPDFIMPGFNYRLTEFQAAFGITQMAKLDRIISKRQELAHSYDTLLKESKVTAPSTQKNSYHVYQSYVTLLPVQLTKKRPQIITALRSLGIETNIGTWHMPLTTYFRKTYGYQVGDYPVCDHVFESTLTLPLHEYLTFTDQQEIIRSLENFA